MVLLLHENLADLLSHCIFSERFTLRDAIAVITNGTRMRPGYLRWNGVPYSDAAVVTEYYNQHSDFGIDWFTVTTVVEDPKYLAQPFITSSSFKKEPDDSKFSPTPCDTPAPRSGAAVGNQNP